MRREYSIYRTLRLLSKQRVCLVLQPGNVRVIEKALPDSEKNKENLETCLMRGWIEILNESVPVGKLGEDGQLPDGPLFNEEKHIYRLTDGGWNAIHRTHTLTILSIIATLASVAIAI